MERDYYDILGVARNASREEIKAAYGALAHHFRPANGNGDERQFLKITEAYRVLSNDGSRARFDQELKSAQSNNFGQPQNALDDKAPLTEATTSRRGIFTLVIVLVIAGVLGYYMVQSLQSPNVDTTFPDTQSTASSSISAGSVDNSSPTHSPQLEQPQSTVSPSANLSPSVIAQIEPIVVEINCYSADESLESSGSGISYAHNGLNLIETNYHVYAGAIVGGQAPNCYAVFPEPPNFAYNGNYGDYQLALDAWSYNPNTYEDAADFILGPPLSSSIALNSIPVINNFYKKLGPTAGICTADQSVNVGDGLTIFGYPNSGNLLGISETVTEGIVSGIVSGPIYKTNAAIDHGNSGGIAILNKNDCALGIPTLGDSGLTAGIGYIQSYTLANEPIN